MSTELTWLKNLIQDTPLDARLESDAVKADIDLSQVLEGMEHFSDIYPNMPAAQAGMTTAIESLWALGIDNAVQLANQAQKVFIACKLTGTPTESGIRISKRGLLSAEAVSDAVVGWSVHRLVQKTSHVSVLNEKLQAYVTQHFPELFAERPDFFAPAPLRARQAHLTHLTAGVHVLFSAERESTGGLQQWLQQNVVSETKPSSSTNLDI